MDNNAYLVSSIAGLATIFLVNKWLDYTTPNLDAIPAVGATGRLSSFIGAYKFFHSGHAMIQEGIQKYGTAAFRVPMMDKWAVVLSQPKLVNDIRQARDEDLSFYDAVNESIQTRYTLGEDLINNHYHVGVIRSPLTRNLAVRFSDIRDEIVAAFDDNIPKGNDWVSVRALDTVMQVVARTSNRLFVGLPLCRDPDYCDLNIKFTIDVFVTGVFLNTVPKIFRPFLGPLLAPMPGALKRSKKHLEPVIIQRLREDAQLGVDREDRPNDLISWLIDAAPESERNTRSLIKRILVVNFAAIHTSSNTFTQALLQLAGRPEYIQPLREEVESIIGEEGWTKAAMGKMRKIDSFIRECIRWEGLSSLVMGRRVQKPEGFTFSDGTHLPQGTFVACAGWDIHHSADNYIKPLEFDGLRFSDMREEEGESTSHQVVNTSPEHLPFGHGRHACPGRFFAANELKAMLAHVVLNYDVKLETGIPPPSRWFGQSAVMDKEAQVLFRKRRA